MKSEEKLIIIDANWSDYGRFKSLCCVDTIPFGRGQCWTLGILDDSGNAFDDADAGFIGFDWCYRHNSVREQALQEYEALPRISRYTWMNANMRQLSRIMIRQEHRGKGYASWLLKMALCRVDARYIECVTFTEKIRYILENAGFEKFGKTGGMGCDYFLFRTGKEHKMPVM